MGSIAFLLLCRSRSGDRGRFANPHTGAGGAMIASAAAFWTQLAPRGMVRVVRRNTNNPAGPSARPAPVSPTVGRGGSCFG